jgi:hypothetical protein
MLGDLPRDIEKQSVVHFESAAGKREQAGEDGDGKK